MVGWLFVASDCVAKKCPEEAFRNLRTIILCSTLCGTALLLIIWTPMGMGAMLFKRPDP
jgi:hypothetical protein